MSSLKLLHSGGNGVIIAAPSSNPASDVTFTLPSADGSASQVIKTDASGNLSFGTKGRVLSRNSTTLTSGDFAVTGTTSSICTGLNTSITLSNANNKVLIVANLRIQVEGGSNTNTRAQIDLLRDSTPIDGKFFGYFHSGGSSKNIYQEITVFTFDTPADTNSHTYKIRGNADTSGVIFRIIDGDVSGGIYSSHMHVMEFEV
jgi:hypothetical protein|tara:strand:- start:2593 stop:3198 length:606 start_codon:yes stop_codon:yes gene_type:complete